MVTEPKDGAVAGSSIKTTKTTTTNGLHYLEAMACPYGCVNGGGSAKKSSSSDQQQSLRETPTETRHRVGLTVNALQMPVASMSTKVVPKRTRYHVVPPMNYTMGAAAGVKVDDIQW